MIDENLSGSGLVPCDAEAGMKEATRRRLFRMVIPRYPAFNVYSHIAKKTTALGPLCVATSVSRMPGWDCRPIAGRRYSRDQSTWWELLRS